MDRQVHLLVFMVTFFSADRIMCNSTLCQHEGTCIDEVNESYYCQCKTGYDGIHCDTRTDTGTLYCVYEYVSNQ